MESIRVFLAWLNWLKKLGGGFFHILYFQPHFGKIPILTNLFQMGWNHQPVMFRFREFTPQKSNIDINHCDALKGIAFSNPSAHCMDCMV